MADNCRECRKFGEKLFLKGDRCLSPKCALTRKANTPGAAPVRGSNMRKRKKSEYGTQLFEKQKAKSEYGLRERQFVLVHKKASKSEEATGVAMLQILEQRLDNVIYRLGWASSRTFARQMVNHGHIKVNGNVVDIPSYQVNKIDIIEPVKIEFIKKNANEKANIPSWIKNTAKTYKAEIVDTPKREEIETPIDEQLIVEFYSR
jgi:small subunit ribosomal protein S4